MEYVFITPKATKKEKTGDNFKKRNLIINRDKNTKKKLKMVNLKLGRGVLFGFKQFMSIFFFQLYLGKFGVFSSYVVYFFIPRFFILILTVMGSFVVSIIEDTLFWNFFFPILCFWCFFHEFLTRGKIKSCCRVVRYNLNENLKRLSQRVWQW